ncbi:MAG TPA: CAP domain-containing protein [Chloroflexota bacterium]|nr:CAP domain-containing protein [Chloroflexota bacterium]
MRRRAAFSLAALPLLVTSPLAAQEEEVSVARAAELTVVNLINLFRLDHGLRPLELDPTLTDLARARSSDMANRGYFGHYTPEGQHGPHLLQAQLAGGPYTAENLGVTGEGYETAMWSLFDEWVASPTHLFYILRPEFNWLGVGVAEAPTPFQSVTFKIVTQVFVEQRGPIRRV